MKFEIPSHFGSSGSKTAKVSVDIVCDSLSYPSKTSNAMMTAAEKLHILVIQHLEHVGVGEDIIGPLKATLEKGKNANGSMLYELFCTATGEGLTPQQQQQQQQMLQQRAVVPEAQQGRMTQVQQQKGRNSMSMLVGAAATPGTRMSAQMTGSVAYSNMLAAMQQVMPPTKPIIAKEPEQRNQRLDEQLMQAAKSGSVDTIPGLINQGAYENTQDTIQFPKVKVPREIKSFGSVAAFPECHF